MICVRNPAGEVLFYLEGDDAIPRDEAGKPIASRAGKDEHTATLTQRAARWMNGRPLMLDLSPGDVQQPGTRADFGTPSIKNECLADLVSPLVYVSRNLGYWITENVGDAIKLVIA